MSNTANKMATQSKKNAALGTTAKGKIVHWFVDGESVCGQAGKFRAVSEATQPTCQHCKNFNGAAVEKITPLTVDQAIAQSQAKNEIVTVEYNVDQALALNTLCDDYVEANNRFEFWGTDGGEWRVHMRKD